ncbi:AAA domain-containing protein [Sporosarcina cyprini]|uniref:AAA domain-containing protein n=1 Tax=Sporosarcina cyprini TaxID=2910523 RepID=UPI001EE11B87|nr:AAA domain-containing protein [Sporosarcina cyprini]MCG3088373.1 AAA domain-containing protein [Sporosarcina cyprini]
MDSDRYLILIKNEDKTDQIDSCEFRNGKWQVKFRNTYKWYTYSEKHVVRYSNPSLLDPLNSIVYADGQPVSGIQAIHDFGLYIRLVFKNGFKKAYISSQLTIENSCLSNTNAANCFGYLKALADQVSIKPEDENLSFLSKQYNRMTAISPQSALAMYLERKTVTREPGKSQVIFPFGFNASQKSAAEKAICGQISVIAGPPGTGKTQTILNIIANAVLNNKTVAVVSNNNSATANVLEKLQKYGLDFIAAYLGNRENKERFFTDQSGTYPDMESWLLSGQEHQSIKSNLEELMNKLNEMLAIKNKSAQLKQTLTMLRTEYKYFEEYYTKNNYKELRFRSIFKLESDKIMKIIIKYKDDSKSGKHTIGQKIYNFFMHGIYKSDLYKYEPETVVSFLQKKYYDLKIAELEREIKNLTAKLARYNFDAAMTEFSEESMRLFKSNLVKKYGQRSERKVFSSDVLWKNTSEFIKEYPVVLSTTHSLRNNVAENYLFDYVLIDEASQVDIVTGALALSCAKNAVIVGDTKQLPNVVTTEVREKANRIFDTHRPHPGYNYTEQSLLSSIVTLFEDIPRTLLKEHYRCHPKIIGFCNQKFYNNELVVLTENNEIEKPLLLYQTVKGNHARGTFNQRQIDVVFNEILSDQEIDVQAQSLGIITPYRQQANEFQKKIGEQNIEADTVHKFQGREKDIIILSTVSNEIANNDFADDANLINVAVSRAVDRLIVVTADGSDNWHGTNIGDLIRYIRYNNFEVIESEIYSVFDLLYKSYSKQLLEVMRRSKKVSDYDSENLMNIVIKRVLGQAEFRSLDYVLHQPLRMLLKNTDKLTADEIKYLMNILTHTDFVIFNRLDKMPLLVVEVDGHAYHANNPKQLERDRMKDRILQKYGIPIIRMKTTGSEEEKVLRNKLVELMAKGS